MSLEKMVDERVISKYYFDLNNFRFKEVFNDKKYVWDALKNLDKYITVKLEELGMGDRSGVQEVVYVDDNVYIGIGTKVDRGAIIHGPSIIGDNCEIRAGCHFRGNVLVGDKAILGGEFKSSILFDESEAPHYCYIGNSIIGYLTNMAAGVITSPHNFNWTNIIVGIGGEKYDTEMVKFGSIVGDRSVVSSNCVLNPGSLIGKNSIIYPLISWRGFLESEKIAKSNLEIVKRDMNRSNLRESYLTERKLYD